MMANQEHLQNLSGAILNGVDFYQTDLIDANLNGITLTDARLWETQRTDGPCKGSPVRLPIGDRDRQKREAQLDSRGVIGQAWCHRLFLQAFLRGAWLRRPPLEKWFHIKGLRPLQGV